LAGSLAAGGRGQSAQALAVRLAGTTAETAPRHPGIASALAATLVAAAPADLILIFGSVYAAAESVQLLSVSVSNCV